MNKTVLLFTSILFIGFGYSDDIYTSNGCVVENVRILKNDGRTLSFKTSNNILITCTNPDIERIEVNPQDISKPSTINKCQGPIWEAWTIAHGGTPQFVKSEKYKYPNIKFLPTALVLLALSYDYWDQGQQQNKTLQQLQSIRSETDTSFDEKNKIERRRFQKYAISGLCAIAAGLSIYYSFEKIEIRLDGSGLALTYHIR